MRASSACPKCRSPWLDNHDYGAICYVKPCIIQNNSCYKHSNNAHYMYIGTNWEKKNKNSLHNQGLSQELETGCLKLVIVKFVGFQIVKGDHNILRFQP